MPKIPSVIPSEVSSIIDPVPPSRFPLEMSSEILSRFPSWIPPGGPIGILPRVSSRIIPWIESEIAPAIPSVISLEVPLEIIPEIPSGILPQFCHGFQAIPTAIPSRIHPEVPSRVLQLISSGILPRTPSNTSNQKSSRIPFRDYSKSFIRDSL